MKYPKGCLLAVRDISVSKTFMKRCFIKRHMDIGVHVTYEGFSLQQGMLPNSLVSKEPKKA